MQFTSDLNKSGTAWTKQQKAHTLRFVIIDSYERILMASKPTFAERDKSGLKPSERNVLFQADLT